MSVFMWLRAGLDRLTLGTAMVKALAALWRKEASDAYDLWSIAADASPDRQYLALVMVGKCVRLVERYEAAAAWPWVRGRAARTEAAKGARDG